MSYNSTPIKNINPNVNLSNTPIDVNTPSSPIGDANSFNNSQDLNLEAYNACKYLYNVYYNTSSTPTSNTISNNIINNTGNNESDGEGDDLEDDGSSQNQVIPPQNNEVVQNQVPVQADYNNDLFYACLAQKLGNGTVQVTPSPVPSPSPAPVPTPSVPTYTLSDVAAHNKSNDCWMVVNNKVYNATSYISSHPGGSAILQGCGKDATSMFASIHSPNAYNILDSYFIGNLK